MMGPSKTHTHKESNKIMKFRGFQLFTLSETQRYSKENNVFTQKRQLNCDCLAFLVV